MTPMPPTAALRPRPEIPRAIAAALTVADDAAAKTDHIVEHAQRIADEAAAAQAEFAAWITARLRSNWAVFARLSPHRASRRLASWLALAAGRLGLEPGTVVPCWLTADRTDLRPTWCDLTGHQPDNAPAHPKSAAHQLVAAPCAPPALWAAAA